MRKMLSGITTWEEAWMAIQKGMDALGFVLEPKSRRYVNPERAREIILRLPPFISTIGVFENTPRYVIQELVTFCRLDRLLFLGQESPKECKDYFQPIIKYLSSLNDCNEYEGINTFLIDVKEKTELTIAENRSLYFIVPGTYSTVPDSDVFYGIYYLLNPDGSISEAPLQPL
jgi:phosphoribosylanthranilate isomerase